MTFLGLAAGFFLIGMGDLNPILQNLAQWNFFLEAGSGNGSHAGPSWGHHAHPLYVGPVGAQPPEQGSAPRHSQRSIWRPRGSGRRHGRSRYLCRRPRVRSSALRGLVELGTEAHRMDGHCSTQMGFLLLINALIPFLVPNIGVAGTRRAHRRLRHRGEGPDPGSERLVLRFGGGRRGRPVRPASCSGVLNSRTRSRSRPFDGGVRFEELHRCKSLTCRLPTFTSTVLPPRRAALRAGDEGRGRRPAAIITDHGNLYGAVEFCRRPTRRGSAHRDRGLLRGRVTPTGLHTRRTSGIT